MASSKWLRYRLPLLTRRICKAPSRRVCGRAGCAVCTGRQPGCTLSGQFGGDVAHRGLTAGEGAEPRRADEATGTCTPSRLRGARNEVAHVSAPEESGAEGRAPSAAHARLRAAASRRHTQQRVPRRASVSAGLCRSLSDQNGSMHLEPLVTQAIAGLDRTPSAWPYPTPGLDTLAPGLTPSAWTTPSALPGHPQPKNGGAAPRQLALMLAPHSFNRFTGAADLQHEPPRPRLL